MINTHEIIIKTKHKFIKVVLFLMINYSFFFTIDFFHFQETDQNIGAQHSPFARTDRRLASLRFEWVVASSITLLQIIYATYTIHSLQLLLLSKTLKYPVFYFYLLYFCRCRFPLTSRNNQRELHSTFLPPFRHWASSITLGPSPQRGSLTFDPLSN